MSLVLIGTRKFQKRREKLFGDGRPRPMDRNAKTRVMVYARALMRRTEAGPGFRSEAQRAKRSGFGRFFQARQARLGMAS